MNTARIKIEGVGDGVILARAATALDLQRAGVVAARRAAIALRGRHQLMLKVRVADVAPAIIKEPGINLCAKLNDGTAAVSFTNSNPFTVRGGSLLGTNASTTSFGASRRYTAPDAMESADIVRTRSEALRTAFRGETMTTSYPGVDRSEPGDIGK